MTTWKRRISGGYLQRCLVLISTIAFITSSCSVLRPHSGSFLLPEAAKHVVIVDIDERSISELGGMWPVRRAVHANAIKSLAKGDPIAIFYDGYFADAELFSFEDDAVLLKVLTNSSVQVVLPALNSLPRILGHTVSGVKFGDPGISFDRSGTVRKMATFGDRTGLPTCAAILACMVAGVPISALPNVSVDLFLPRVPFERISLMDLLESAEYRDDGFLRDKVVVVGLSQKQLKFRTSWGKEDYNVVQAVGTACLIAELLRIKEDMVAFPEGLGSSKRVQGDSVMKSLGNTGVKNQE